MPLPERLTGVAQEASAERLRMSPRVEALLRTDGVSLAALFAFRCLRPSEVMTNSGIFYGLLAAQELDRHHTTEEGDPVEEGWVMNHSTPISWYKPLATEEVDVVIPGAEGGYLANDAAEPTVLSTVPLIELIAESEFSQIGLFGRSPATRLALFKGIVALAGESTEDVTFTPKQLEEVSGVGDVHSHLKTLRFQNLLEYVSRGTEGERYVHYRLASESNPEIPIQHKEPALHALASTIYNLLYAQRTDRQGLTVSQIVASLSREALPGAYREMPVDELEDAVAGVIKRWRDKRPEKDGHPGMVEYGEGTLTKDQQSIATVRAEHVAFLRKLVTAADRVMGVDAASSAEVNELEAWAQNGDALLKNPSIMRTILGKAHRDSFKAEALSSSEMAHLIQTILAANATDPSSPALTTTQIHAAVVEQLGKRKDARYIEQVLSQLEETGIVIGEKKGREQQWMLPIHEENVPQAKEAKADGAIAMALIEAVTTNTFSPESLMEAFPTKNTSVVETVAFFLQKGYLQKTASGELLPTQAFNNLILSRPALLTRVLRQLVAQGNGAISSTSLLACTAEQFQRFAQADTARLLSTQTIIPIRMASVSFPPELRMRQAVEPADVVHFLRSGTAMDDIQIVLPFNVGTARPTVKQGKKESVLLTQVFQTCMNLLRRSYTIANLSFPEDMVGFVAENVFGLPPEKVQRPDRRSFLSA